MRERAVYINEADYLGILHSTKNDRVTAARSALRGVFGNRRVHVHAGSDSYGEDTTNRLYVTIALKKKDKRNSEDYEAVRKEVIDILLASEVPLFNTSYPLSKYDDYAVVLDVEKFKSVQDKAAILRNRPQFESYPGREGYRTFVNGKKI